MKLLRLVEKFVAIFDAIFSVAMIAFVAKAVSDELKGRGPDPDDYYGQKDEV